jgi:hypothetical protein
MLARYKEVFIEDAVSLISVMDHDELNAVVRAINARRKDIDQNATAKFSVGDQVWFSGKGRIVNGVVTKVNRKTISVKAVGNQMWRVSASLLKHCKEPCQDYIN